MTLIRHLMTILLVLLSAFLSCCTKKSKTPENRIGIDISWFPLSLEGRENQITGFSTELLKEIGKIEKIPMIKITVTWDNLIEGLQKHKYDAILSSIPPYVFNQKLYDFSELYLSTGPVLVVPLDSTITSLKQIKGTEIAVLPETRGALLLEKYPGVIIRTYDSIPKALNAMIQGTLDGAIVDVLSAVAYCRDLYQDQLHIITEPLNTEGLRMLVVHDQAPELLFHFNRGLEKLKSSGVYDKLLIKWGLKNANE